VALLAIRAFFPTPGEGAIGAVDYPSDVRQRLAKKSLSWQCTECGITCATALPIIEQASDVDDKLKEQVAQMQIGVRAPPVDGKAEEKKEEDGKANDSKENDSKDLQEEKSPSIQTTKAKSETEKSTKDTSNFTNAQRLENMNRNPQNQSSENSLSFLSLFLLIGILAILVKKLFASSQME
jgi:ubiquitin-conjugating enzyme E2 J1